MFVYNGVYPGPIYEDQQISSGLWMSSLSAYRDAHCNVQLYSRVRLKGKRIVPQSLQLGIVLIHTIFVTLSSSLLCPFFSLPTVSRTLGSRKYDLRVISELPRTSAQTLSSFCLLQARPS
jgi:hypothetical protein